MAWHRLRHRATGEVQVVASLGGIDPAEWEAVKLKANRAPGEFQVVNDDGSVSTDPSLKARRSLTSEDMAAMIEALEARLRNLEA